MPTSVTALNVLLFLLPGFLSDRIIDGLTPPRERSDTVLVIHALVFTFVDYVIYSAVAFWLRLPTAPPQVHEGQGNIFRPHDAAGLGLLLGIAIAIGVGWAAVANAGVIYRVFKWLHITRLTGRSDVWHDVFSDFRRYWFQVWLRDGTRITGWPDYYSDTPNKRELFLRDALVERVGEPDYDVLGPGVLLTERAEIERIEVLPREPEKTYEQRQRQTDN